MKKSHISVLVLVAAWLVPLASRASLGGGFGVSKGCVAPVPAGQVEPSGEGASDANKTLANIRYEPHCRASQNLAGRRLGHGYSKKAILKAGVIYTSDVNDAVRALHEKRKVVLDQPKKISVLMDRLRAVTKRMIALGEQAPLFNLCDVTIRGTNLFCVDSKGISRVEMPQLDDGQTRRFRVYLERKGYKIEDTEELSSMLRATQNELNGARVAKIARFLRKQGEDPNARRLIVSRDNYILDGHHHWAAQVGLDSEDNHFGDLKTRVSRVDINITDLLKEAEAFTGGKRRKSASADRRSIDALPRKAVTAKPFIRLLIR